MSTSRNIELNAAHQLRPGDVLSFSAGTISHSPHRYRILNHVTQTSKYQLITEHLGLQSHVLPFVINAYPAPLGSIPFGVTVDSYLNMSIIIRALRLCALQGGVAIVCCQPLFALHIVNCCKQQNVTLPVSLCFLLGGYYCPSSAEQHLIQSVRECRTACTVLHAYGVTEIDAAIMIGKRLDDSLIAYRQVAHGCQLNVRDEQLYIETEAGTLIPGDRAKTIDGYWVIEQDPRTLSPRIQNELESWSNDQWIRRTGFLQYRQKGSLYQLRKGYTSANAQELEYYDFIRLTDMNWLQKPDWSAL